MISSFFSSRFKYFSEKSPAYFSIFLVFFGYFFFNVNDAFIKILVEHHTTIEIIFWGATFTLLGMSCITAFADMKTVWKTNDLKYHILRGFLTLAYISCNAVGLKYLSLPNFYAIIFLSPMICVLLGQIFFKDHINTAKITALITGFIGVLIVVRPGNLDFSIGVILTFLSAVMHAASLVLIRKIDKSDHYLLFNIVVSIVVFLGALGPYLYLSESLTLPQPYYLFLFFCCGILSSIAATLIAIGFHIAPSTSTVAPFHYMQIIGGIALGYLIWADIPTLSTFIGSIIIIISGLMIIKNEKSYKNKIMHKYPL